MNKYLQTGSQKSLRAVAHVLRGSNAGAPNKAQVQPSDVQIRSSGLRCPDHWSSFFLWPSSILFGTVWGNTAWTLPLYLLHARVSKTRSDARTRRQSWSNDITYQHGRDAEITRWHPSLPVWRGSRKWRGGGGGDSVSSSLFFYAYSPAQPRCHPQSFPSVAMLATARRRRKNEPRKVPKEDVSILNGGCCHWPLHRGVCACRGVVADRVSVQ